MNNIIIEMIRLYILLLLLSIIKISFCSFDNNIKFLDIINDYKIENQKLNIKSHIFNTRNDVIIIFDDYNNNKIEQYISIRQKLLCILNNILKYNNIKKIILKKCYCSYICLLDLISKYNLKYYCSKNNNTFFYLKK